MEAIEFDSTGTCLRRLISILLLAVFGLPLALPLFAQGGLDEAGLPACCRRTGAHQCAMSMAERPQAAPHSPTVSTPAEHCPYCAQAPATVHPDSFAAAPTDALFADLACLPAVHAQTESRWRSARDRSRQKRGPPVAQLVAPLVA